MDPFVSPFESRPPCAFPHQGNSTMARRRDETPLPMDGLIAEAGAFLVWRTRQKEGDDGPGGDEEAEKLWRYRDGSYVFGVPKKERRE